MTTETTQTAEGRFGPYGGRYVPETLMYALRQLTEQYQQARDDPEFRRQFDGYLFCKKLRTFFCQPDLAEAAGAEFSDKRVLSDL